MHPFVSVFYNGEFAVIIFFCISGYVLALPYFEEEKNAQLILRKRLISRYLKLNIPIFFAVFISYYVYVSDLYFIIEAAKISGSIGWAANFWPSKITISSAIMDLKD
jgi:peptidoglycan/LPS O-acetylase OafA/YrhL